MVRGLTLVVFVLVLAACGTTAPPARQPAPSPPIPSSPPPSAPAPSPAPAPEVEAAPEGFVRLRDVDSSILEEVRYATPPRTFMSQVISAAAPHSSRAAESSRRRGHESAMAWRTGSTS